jgi:hypothetical protein
MSLSISRALVLTAACVNACKGGESPGEEAASAWVLGGGVSAADGQGGSFAFG